MKQLVECSHHLKTKRSKIPEKRNFLGESPCYTCKKCKNIKTKIHDKSELREESGCTIKHVPCNHPYPSKVRYCTHHTK